MSHYLQKRRRKKKNTTENRIFTLVQHQNLRITIIKSNSLLLTGLPKTTPYDCKHHLEESSYQYT